MATRGTKPTPDELKRAAGTLRPDRTRGEVVRLPLAIGEIPPPKWLNRDGKAEWKRLLPVLQAHRVLAEVDLGEFGQLCSLHGEIVALCRKGLQPTSADRRELRTKYAEFGCTPSGRARVPRGGPPDDDNPFARNGRRKP